MMGEGEVTCGFCMIHWSFLDRFLLKYVLHEWYVTFLLLVCSVSCIMSTVNAVSDTLVSERLCPVWCHTEFAVKF